MHVIFVSITRIANYSLSFPLHYSCFLDVSCPSLRPPRNGVLDGKVFKYGRRVKYSCNTGYKLVGPISRKCMSTGRWTGKRSKCVKIGENIDFSKLRKVLAQTSETTLER